MFDAERVCVAGLCAPEHDERGRIHLDWPAGALSFDPPAGEVARCELVIASRRGGLIRGELGVTTEQGCAVATALMLVSFMHLGLAPTVIGAPAEQIGQLLECVPSEPAALDELAQLCDAFTVDATGPRASLVLDPLREDPLQRAFRLAVVSGGAVGGGVAVYFSNSTLVFWTRRGSPEMVIGDLVDLSEEFTYEAEVVLSPTRMSLLIAVQEGFSTVDLGGLDLASTQRSRVALQRVREELLAGDTDVIELYQSLRLAFGDRGAIEPSQRPASIGPREIAGVTMAMRCWRAAGTAGAEAGQVDLERLGRVAGSPPLQDDADISMTFGRGELRCRVVGDQAIGRLCVELGSGTVARAPVALRAATLEQVAWCLGGLDLLRPCALTEALRDHLLAVIDPGFDHRRSIAPILRLLEIRRAESGAAELLRRWQD